MSKYSTDGMNSLAVAERLLDNTDWTQIPNSGLTSDCVTAFGTYRASLRTIRKNSNAGSRDPALETWTTKPTEEWT